MRQILILLSSILFLCGCGNSGPNKRHDSEKRNNKEQGQKKVVLTEQIKTGEKPVVNVYVENSGSMDGYVKGVTEFEQAVYSYLSDIRISNFTDQLNLFYINSQVIHQGSDIADFIERLEPATFRARGGNRGTSDISSVIKTILSNSSDSIVSILVSDCIFSPGPNIDAQQYLINQQIGIKVAMSEHLTKYNNSAVLIYQLTSKFDGLYFNRVDSPTKIIDQRPFYIWVIGNTENVFKLRELIPDKKFRGSGVQNIFAISNAKGNTEYAIVPNSGEFRLDKNKPKTNIINAKLSKRGSKKLTFIVNVNFSTLLVDDKYIVNPENYELSDNDFSIEITKCSTLGFTHSLKLSTNIVKPSNLSIKLLNKLPSWVDEYNDDIGLDIMSDGAMIKTFGIKHLFGGVYDAYTITNNYYTNINISINNK